jgi:hypothetical protein
MKFLSDLVNILIDVLMAVFLLLLTLAVLYGLYLAVNFVGVEPVGEGRGNEIFKGMFV